MEEKLAMGKKTEENKTKLTPRQMPEEVKIKSSRVVAIAFGLLFLVLALFTLFALVSYIIYWPQDQSILHSAESLFKGGDAPRNWCGKWGFEWANLLYVELFGVGSFAIPFLFFGLSIYLLKVKRINLVRWLFVVIFGSIIVSLLATYIFSFTSLTNNFTIGGSYGESVNNWMKSIMGPFGTGAVLILFFALWLFLINKNIAHRFDAFIEKTFRVDPEVVAAKLAAKEEKKAAKLAAKEEKRKGKEEKQRGKKKKRDDESPVGVDVEKDSRDNTTEDNNRKSPVDSGTGDDIPLDVEEGPEWLKDIPVEERQKLFDPRLDLSKYVSPSLSILNDYNDKWFDVPQDELEEKKKKIVRALQTYKVSVDSITASVGPTVTLYKVKLAEGVRIAQVKRLEDDIAMVMNSKGVRVVPLLDSIGIEVPNTTTSIVALRKVLSSQAFKNAKMELPVALGLTVSKEPLFIDIQNMPHLLIAGATGTGKSVGLNAIIASLLLTKHPSELKFVMVDPKMVELVSYSKLKNHFLATVPGEEQAIITDTQKVIYTLKSLCVEMDERYKLLSDANTRKIQDYNEKFLKRKLNPTKGHKFLPYIVVVIDEFADLISTAGRDIEEPISRLAAKARAIGIHLIIATQRPTTDVITGTIKANFVSRIAFKVMSTIDSKTILDEVGANRLIGKGDLLVKGMGIELTRAQCAFIDTEEIDNVIDAIASQRGYTTPYYLPEYEDPNEGPGGAVSLSDRDPLFDEVARMVVANQQGSTSMIQRKMKLGYARAGRISDELEAAGIIGPLRNGKREVLVSDLDQLEQILSGLN